MTGRYRRLDAAGDGQPVLPVELRHQPLGARFRATCVQHIVLSLLAVAIGTAISIPLAVLAWRYRIIRSPVFGLASALYIIPSLALFAILGPITGIVPPTRRRRSPSSGYTLLILIWNTVAGPRRRPGGCPRGGDRPRVLPDAALDPGRPAAGAAVHLRRTARGDGHGDRPRHRHRVDRPRGARPADHLRLQHRLQHADHRRPRALHRAGRRGRPPPRRRRNAWSSPGRGRGRGAAMG